MKFGVLVTVVAVALIAVGYVNLPPSNEGVTTIHVKAPSVTRTHNKNAVAPEPSRNVSSNSPALTNQQAPSDSASDPNALPPYKTVKLPSIKTLTQASREVDAPAMQRLINENDQLISEMDQLILTTGLPDDVAVPVTQQQAEELIKQVEEQLAEEEKQRQRDELKQSAL